MQVMYENPMEKLYNISIEKNRMIENEKGNNDERESSKEWKERERQIKSYEKKLKEWNEEKRMELNVMNWDDIWSFDDTNNKQKTLKEISEKEKSIQQAIHEKSLEKIKLKNEMDEATLKYTTSHNLKCNKSKMNQYNQIIKAKNIDGLSLLKMTKNDWMNVFHFDMFMQACVLYDSSHQICAKYSMNMFNSDESISQNIPKEYLCPLSNSIMKDPVIALNRKTYDRPSFLIQYQKIPNYCSLMIDGKLEFYTDFVLQQKIQQFLKESE
ncbi:hypothetical protein RFI_26475 [Reticulomyxa filosa]|uniref:U-box domain-containing protein n=1 Tax=Reticulomyxa filosa TaxID=46433 RepID=X6MBV1_RETFI|nr:hypothetical protein RFI_26475 [Reticulomyxa filosa]|eukprot:ETO10902.1 hypothetical protein RFI_26475 [Reticulomyxa filosa]